MRNIFRTLDSYTKNIIIIFIGASLANFLNLLYQLLIAHKLSAMQFASFNSLLSIFMIISSPLATIQVAVAKYCSEFNTHKQLAKLKFLLSDLSKKGLVLAISTLLIFWFASFHITGALRIPSISSGYILAILLASTWLSPLFAGFIQGLELFYWLALAPTLIGILKLILGYLFLLSGYKISGALAALLVSNLAGIIIFYLVLRRYLTIEPVKESINYKQMLIYLAPVVVSYFCFFSLVSFDMVLVKYFFSQEEAGFYSLAQMVGKIFLFLPAAISVVMLPKTSGLNAKNLDTTSTLKKSLLYASILCISALIIYNIFPSFILKLLTGKAFAESIILGRLFSVSMAFFSLLFILINYFLSIRELGFIKLLVSFTVLQFLAIALFHKNLLEVQIILCINAGLLFCIHFILANKPRSAPYDST